jgi:hypothetical protein
VGTRLGAGEEARAHADAVGAQAHDLSESLGRGHAPGRDERDVDDRPCGPEHLVERLPAPDVAAGLDPLDHDVVTTGRLCRGCLFGGADLPAGEGSARMDRPDEVGARVAVEELDHPSLSRCLGHRLERRVEGRRPHIVSAGPAARIAKSHGERC